MAQLGDFYEGTSKTFDATITYNDTNPDISGDTVKLFLKQRENGANALIATANVSTSGDSGIAKFSITPTQMAIDAGPYFAYLMWYTGSDEYILIKERVTVNEGVGIET